MRSKRNKKGNKISKSKYQIRAIQNVLKSFDLREKIVDFLKDDYLLLYDAQCKSKHGSCIKILNPKQMLQRLPIALAHIKAVIDLKTY